MGKDYKLIKTQKNDIFKIMEKEGLNHSDFRWTGTDVHGVIRLEHKPSKHFIAFSYFQSGHVIEYSVHKSVFAHNIDTRTWLGVLDAVRLWCMFLKQEIDAPDLWSQMEKYTAYISLPPTEDLPDEPISAVDAQEIEDRLWVFANKVEKRFSLVDDDLKFMRNRIEYLVEEVKQSSKKGFVYTAIGVVATIAMGLEVTRENAKALWELLRESLSYFLYLQ